MRRRDAEGASAPHRNGLPARNRICTLPAAAGWRHHDLISYGKFPDQAASAFNRVRLVLQQTQEPDAILAQLKAEKAAS